jgi:NAD(P)-dependent dehydrogenase (short-subunit alcohol dehydrogenase family)
VACNISREEELERLVDRTVDRWGRVDVLVCNAAVSPFFGPAADMPRAAYQKVIDCNITANVVLTNKVAPIMAAQGTGSIVIVSSIGGMRGSTHLGAYAISKAADMQLARNLAVEWGPQGVRANCVAPGLIRTDMAKAFVDVPDVLRRRVHHTPLQRIGEVDEVAASIVMLAGPGGAYISGQTIIIDGGTLAGSPWQTHGGDEPVAAAATGGLR